MKERYNERREMRRKGAIRERKWEGKVQLEDENRKEK